MKADDAHMTHVSAAPRVVALMPTWMASAFILETLNALAAQTCPNLEVTISDDASTDDTAAICEAFAASDSRFRVVRQPHNVGWIGNVNALLREAQGDYLHFAFHDDLPDPEYLERCVSALEANPSAVMAFTDITVVYQDGTRCEESFAALDGIRAPQERAEVMARRPDGWWIPNRGVFRSPSAAAIGGLRRHAAGEFSADWPWLLHMSTLGEFVRVPGSRCTKVFRTQNLSRTWDYRRRAWLAVTLSAVGTVMRTNLSHRGKGRLAALLLLPIPRLPVRSARRRLSKCLGRSGQLR